MDARIAAVIERLHAEIDRPLRGADLAAAVNLSASRLMHLFKREVGMPPARYLRNLRLRRARADLETTFLSVKQVMSRAGFNDPSSRAPSSSATVPARERSAAKLDTRVTPEALQRRQVRCC
jgi:transcriptional regulator GlxA family with amidase domain